MKGFSVLVYQGNWTPYTLVSVGFSLSGQLNKKRFQYRQNISMSCEFKTLKESHAPFHKNQTLNIPDAR